MTALSFHRFETLMTPFSLAPGAHIAVGVSGGADSLCLTLFLARWAKEHHLSLTALTVQHNLRKEAEQEAQNLHAFLTQKGISHHILFNHLPVPETNIESYARQVRYQLMSTFCEEHKISHLFLAHHAGDQSETFLLRLSKSSGVKGLSGMRFISQHKHLCLCRPFLFVPKSDLTTALQKQKIAWAEDQMNHDERFERVKWRHFFPTLETAGIRASAVCESMRRLSRADEALEKYTLDFIRQNVWIDFRGFARLPVELWRQTPDEIQLRVLHQLILCISQSTHFISLKALENLCADLPCDKTLGGCQLKPHKTGLYICRERRKMAGEKAFKAGTPFRWDRFIVTPFIDGFIRAGAPQKKISTVPAAVQNTFPAVFMQKMLEKITQIDYKEKNDSSVQIEFIGKNGDKSL